MRASAIALAAAAALLAGGCSVGRSGQGEEAKPLTEVIADAQHARDSASSVHVSGSFGGLFGHSIEVNLWVANGKGEAGWMYVYKRGGANGTYDLRIIGTDLYIRGNFASLARLHGGPIPPKGTWLKASTTSGGALAELYALVAPSKLFPLLDADPRTLTDRGWDDLTVTGQPGVIIDSMTGGEMYIAATGAPYPISMDWEDEGTELNFGNWNAPVPLTAPEPALDASTFGLG